MWQTVLRVPLSSGVFWVGWGGGGGTNGRSRTGFWLHMSRDGEPFADWKTRTLAVDLWARRAAANSKLSGQWDSVENSHYTRGQEPLMGDGHGRLISLDRFRWWIGDCAWSVLARTSTRPILVPMRGSSLSRRFQFGNSVYFVTGHSNLFLMASSNRFQ